MKRLAVSFLICLWAAATVGGEPVKQRWGGQGMPCTHPGTLKVIRSGVTTRLAFDLSALPKGAKVRHASLFCFKGTSGQPAEPIQIFITDSLGQDGQPAHAGKPLPLEAPYYRSFDATEAVRRWVKEPGQNFGFTVARFEGLQPGKSYLEVLYEGEAPEAPAQVTGVRALHHDGQTFIVWKEIPEYRPKKEEIVWVDHWDESGDKVAEGPGKDAFGRARLPAIRIKTLRGLQGLAWKTAGRAVRYEQAREVPPVRYRIYRHARPISADNFHEAEFVGEAGPLCGYDEKMRHVSFQGEYLNQKEVDSSLIPTYCIDDGKPIWPGEALFVHTPQKPSAAYYAVTTVWAGTENVSQVSEANSLSEPVVEKPSPPRPVLQFVQKDRYVAETPEYWHVFWAAAPAYYNLPAEPFHVTVGAPKNFKGPGPMFIKAPNHGGGFNIRSDMTVPSRSGITLMIEQHIPWGTDLCFNAGRGTLRSFKECKVDFFSERHVLHIINWVRSKWAIDPARITGSMLHFGIRHPEIFAKMSFGTYTASYDVRWAPGSRGLPALLGPKGIKTVDGEDAWSAFNVGWYVKKHPKRDIPFLVCISAVGKDAGHTSEFGWQDDPRGWKDLLDARQTFVATWGSEQGRAWFLHPEMSKAFGKMRWDVSIPAFGNCSLDNNPGSGDPADGDPCGQINGYLLWEDASQFDQQGRWELTVYLVGTTPEESCTVDITPRHCKGFKPRKGQSFKWTNTDLKTNKIVQSGPVEADASGLVTLRKVEVTKGRNRIAIFQ
jgi:hypothetical protein